MKKLIQAFALLAGIFMILPIHANAGRPQLYQQRLEVGRALLEMQSTNVAEALPYYTDDIEYHDPIVDIYGIEERGYLKSGYFADVLVFDPGGYAPRADYVNPRELATGVTALFVNGALAVENSNPTGTTAGRVLLRPAPANCQARPR